MKSLRFFLIQFLLVIVFCVLAIFLAEQFARKRFPDLRDAAERQQRPESLFMRFDPRLGWTNIPGASVRFARLEFDTQVTINEDGFRGPRVPLARPPGWNRIVVLGDSYVFGHGVDDDETFCARMAEQLPRTEVVNLGVTGYSTDQELLLLQHSGLAYEPDAVVLCFYANDLLDNGQATAWGLYRKPRFLLSPDGSLKLETENLTEGVPFRMRLQRELRRRFVLYDVVAYRLRRAERGVEAKPDVKAERGAQAERSTEAEHGAQAERSTEAEHGAQAERSVQADVDSHRANPAAAGSVSARVDGTALSRALVQKVAETCRDHGVPLLLVVLPGIDDSSLFAHLPPPRTGTRLDLAPLFAEYERTHPDSALGFTHDTHWNERGHRFVAEVLASEIERQGWLGTRVPSGLE